MKLHYLLLLTIIINSLLFSDEEVINLQNMNKRSRPQPMMEMPEKRDFVNQHNGVNILPKGLFIGELGDYYVSNDDSKAIISITDNFFSSLKDNAAPAGIDRDYIFIFNSVYKDILLSDSSLVNWFIGNPMVYLKSGEVFVELHLQDSVITGVIYLEKDEYWKINDVQLEKKEKRVFEPSSPYNLF